MDFSLVKCVHNVFRTEYNIKRSVKTLICVWNLIVCLAEFFFFFSTFFLCSSPHSSSPSCSTYRYGERFSDWWQIKCQIKQNQTKISQINSWATENTVWGQLFPPPLPEWLIFTGNCDITGPDQRTIIQTPHLFLLATSHQAAFALTSEEVSAKL